MTKHTFKTLLLTIVTMLFVGIFLSGCTPTKSTTVKSAGDTTPVAPEAVSPATETETETVTPPPTPDPSAPVPSSGSTQESLKLTLYFPNADASGLIATERTVVVKNKEVIKTMFTELATPPSGLEKPLPQGTTLLDATVNADGVATINLSADFKKNFAGGSAGEQMTMYSIVNTLTTLPTVKSVQFLLDGKKQDGILGNLDTSTPLVRNESLISAAK